MSMTAEASRCTTRACPVIYRGGPDRPCPMHSDDPSDSMLGRMAAFAALAPGEATADTDSDSADSGNPGGH